ncbi:MAG: FeoA family protein [Saprospiraceae bacterium]
MVAVLSDQKQYPGVKVSPNGQKIISHFTDEGIASKLMSMGILPGSHIALVRKAPMGGGWYLKIDNKILALREKELGCIVMR